jgi:hypothetical protein
MYNHQIYQLRQVELDPTVAAKLWPFINSYRPHDSIVSWRELRADGNEPVEKESALDELNEYYYETHGYYPEEHPALAEQGVTLGETVL